jgi:hypothetical protein
LIEPGARISGWRSVRKQIKRFEGFTAEDALQAVVQQSL